MIVRAQRQVPAWPAAWPAASRLPAGAPWPVRPLHSFHFTAAARLPPSGPAAQLLCRTSARAGSGVAASSGLQQERAYAKKVQLKSGGTPDVGGEVEGLVKSVTFSSDSGYRVLRVELSADTIARLGLPKSHMARFSKTQVVVTGILSHVQEGMSVRFEGRWEQHSKYGHQFAAQASAELPSTDPAAVKQLLQKCIKGCGKKRAELLVAAFGPGGAVEVLDAPDAVQQLLARQVPGISARLAQEFKDSWDDSRLLRGAVQFLVDGGLSPALAQRVAKRHKAATQALVMADPYTAIWGTRGATFRGTDALARSLGLPADFPSRAQVALLSELVAAANGEGHTYLHWSVLKDRALRLMEASGPGWPLRAASTLEQCMQELQQRGKVRCEGTSAGSGAPGGLTAESRCAWGELARAEDRCASVLTGLVARDAKRKPKPNEERSYLEAWLQGYERSQGLTFTEEQRFAIMLAGTSAVLTLTGAAGCGKTYATQAIVALWLAQGKRVSICAPTGRAANRLQEMVSAQGVQATTIHRLLGYRPRGKDSEEGEGMELLEEGGEDEGGDRQLWSFTHHERNPLPTDAVLVDEASMLDVALASALLAALPQRCHVVLVGDPNQLPPVGPGSVLASLLAAPHLPSATLTQIQRQSANSSIVTTAHDIMHGRSPKHTRRTSLAECKELVQSSLVQQLPSAPAAPSSSSSPAGAPSASVSAHIRLDGTDAIIVTLPDNTPASAMDAEVASLIQLLAAQGVDVHRDVQVLSPQRRGVTGTRSLNPLLQPIMNPGPPGSTVLQAASQAAADGEGRGWRLGDRVVQNVNDYDKEVYNGDIGSVVGVNAASGWIKVRFMPRPGKEEPHVIELSKVDQAAIEPAWATTVHKAQGGEFRIAVVPMHHHCWRPLLTRPLLYTAVTRAKQLLLLVTTEAALQQCLVAVSSARNTNLLERLVAKAMEAGIAAGSSAGRPARQAVSVLDPEVELSPQELQAVALGEAEMSDAEDMVALSVGMAVRPPARAYITRNAAAPRGRVLPYNRIGSGSSMAGVAHWPPPQQPSSASLQESAQGGSRR